MLVKWPKLVQCSSIWYNVQCKYCDSILAHHSTILVMTVSLLHLLVCSVFLHNLKEAYPSVILHKRKHWWTHAQIWYDLRVDLHVPDTVVTAIVMDVFEHDATSEYAHTQVSYRRTQKMNTYKVNSCQRWISVLEDAKMWRHTTLACYNYI